MSQAELAATAETGLLRGKPGNHPPGGQAIIHHDSQEGEMPAWLAIISEPEGANPASASSTTR